MSLGIHCIEHYKKILIKLPGLETNFCPKLTEIFVKETKSV